MNKRERKAPLPSQDQPAFKHRKKAKKDRKPYKIEVQYHIPGISGISSSKWFTCHSYASEESRDQALACLQSKKRKYLFYRSANTPKEA